MYLPLSLIFGLCFALMIIGALLGFAVCIPAAGPRPGPSRKFRPFAVCLPCGVFASNICVRILGQTAV